MKKLFLLLAFFAALFLLSSCGDDSGGSDEEIGDFDITVGSDPTCDDGGASVTDNIAGWSELASSEMSYYEAVDYCENLEEGGFTNWRLPRISELRSLVQNCKAVELCGTCAVTSENRVTGLEWNCGCPDSVNENGETNYSKLGDSVILWSFSNASDDLDQIWVFDFSEGILYTKYSSNSLSVRCVRNKDNSENSYVSSDIPKPVIKAKFNYTIGGKQSYRNTKDTVVMQITELSVSDDDKYFYRFKWEMIESPTPLSEYSYLSLTDSDSRTGMWMTNLYEKVNLFFKAEFKGLMVTPARYSAKNSEYDESKCESECGSEPTDTGDGYYAINFSNYLICRQKYCEEYESKNYKVKITAVTIDRSTGYVSEPSEVILVPEIIPQARVVAQLTWDKGYKTRDELSNNDEGEKVDLDLHMIKRTSLEAPTYGYSHLDGLMGTSQKPASLGDEFIDEKYSRHDDCSFSDQGYINSTYSETIAWHASFDIDNIWGGGDFGAPETIGLGPIEDNDGDGVPDDPVMDDQYLIVAGYVYCISVHSDGQNRCSKDYSGEDSVYDVNARVQIFVNGDEVPRAEKGDRPADNYKTTTKDFVIHPGEWKVVAVVKWDSTLPGPESNPEYPGDGIVSDVAMTDHGIETDAESYKTCNFPISEAVLVPIWNQQDYYDYVTLPDGDSNSSVSIGECY